MSIKLHLRRKLCCFWRKGVDLMDRDRRLECPFNSWVLTTVDLAATPSGSVKYATRMGLNSSRSWEVARPAEWRGSSCPERYNTSNCLLPVIQVTWCNDPCIIGVPRIALLISSEIHSLATVYISYIKPSLVKTNAFKETEIKKNIFYIDYIALLSIGWHVYSHRIPRSCKQQEWERIAREKGRTMYEQKWVYQPMQKTCFNARKIIIVIYEA